jgi:serine/threonine protein kinase
MRLFESTRAMTTDIDSVTDAFPELGVEGLLGSGTFKVAYKVRRDGTEVVLKVVIRPTRSDTSDEDSSSGETNSNESADAIESSDLSLEDEVEEGDSLNSERFRREILAMNAVTSRHVATVVDGPAVREVGGENHVWYLEPYYSGGTLAARLTNPNPPGFVAKLLQELLAGVEALWDQARLVHRDIKPANIAIDGKGTFVLLDLGIALHEELSPMTASGALSPRTDKYCAPEQFKPRRMAEVDFRTDLFNVGLVAFEALTGKHPFDPHGQLNAYILRLERHQFDQAALDAVNNEEKLKEFILRLLMPTPSERFRTVDAASRRLREATK